MNLLPQAIKTCSRFTALLGVFHPAIAGQSALEAALISAARIPQPMRGLLVHHRDMTSTLARYYHDEIVLDELERRHHEDWLIRHIILRCRRTGRPVEYGASRIHLAILPSLARQKVLDGAAPLGGILNTAKIEYTSCPGGFFHVEPNTYIRTALRAPAADAFYGRCNCLKTRTGDTIAEVVEVVPPEPLDENAPCHAMTEWNHRPDGRDLHRDES